MEDVIAFPLSVEDVARFAESYGSTESRSRFPVTDRDYSDHFKRMFVALHATFHEAQMRFATISSDREILAQPNASDAELARYASKLIECMQTCMSSLADPSMDIDDRQGEEYAFAFRGMAVLSLVESITLGNNCRLPAWVALTNPEARARLVELKSTALSDPSAEFFFDAVDVLAVFNDKEGVCECLEAWLQSMGHDEEHQSKEGQTLFRSVQYLASFYRDVPALSDLPVADFEEAVEKRRAFASSAMIALGGVPHSSPSSFLWRLHLLPDEDREWLSDKLDQVILSAISDSPWYVTACLRIAWLYPTAKDPEITKIVLEETISDDTESNAIDEVFMKVLLQDFEGAVIAAAQSAEHFGGPWFVAHLTDFLFFCGSLEEESGGKFRALFLNAHSRGLVRSLPDLLGSRLSYTYSPSAKTLIDLSVFDPFGAMRLAVDAEDAETAREISRCRLAAETDDVLSVVRWASQAEEISHAAGNKSAIHAAVHAGLFPMVNVSGCLRELGSETVLNAMLELADVVHGESDGMQSLVNCKSGRLEWLMRLALVTRAKGLGKAVDVVELVDLVTSPSVPEDMHANIVNQFVSEIDELDSMHAMKLMTCLEMRSSDLLGRGREVSSKTFAHAKNLLVASLLRMK